jgi:hypothetical protein
VGLFLCVRRGSLEKAKVIWANIKESDSLILWRRGNGFLLGISEKYSKKGDGGRGKLGLFTGNGREVSLENSPLLSLLSELISLLFSSSPAFFQNSFITLSAFYLNLRISHKNEVCLIVCIYTVNTVGIFAAVIPVTEGWNHPRLFLIHLRCTAMYHKKWALSFLTGLSRTVRPILHNCSSPCAHLQHFYFVSVLSGKFIIISFAAFSPLMLTHLLYFPIYLIF